MLYDLLSGLETTYPFPRTTKVEAGATIAIWSSGEAEHKPKEGQYVMKVSFVTDPMQDLPFVETVLQCTLNFKWSKDFNGSNDRKHFSVQIGNFDKI